MIALISAGTSANGIAALVLDSVLAVLGADPLELLLQLAMKIAMQQTTTQGRNVANKDACFLINAVIGALYRLETRDNAHSST